MLLQVISDEAWSFEDNKFLHVMFVRFLFVMACEHLETVHMCDVKAYLKVLPFVCSTKCYHLCVDVGYDHLNLDLIT
jgi:hypothetical protein